jgi:hypothetical protein
MAVESTNGLGTFARYGAPVTEQGLLGAGGVKSYGTVHEVVAYIDSSDFGADETYATQLVIPAGAIPIDAVFDVTTAVTQTGGTTSLTLYVGTDGSEATNGFSITEAATTLATTTAVDSSGAGTWAAALAADTTVGVALVAGGGTITSVDGGKAKVVVRYHKI